MWDGYLDAYEMLVKRHSDMAYRVALRLCGDHYDAQDIAQEAFIAARPAGPPRAA